VLDEGPAALLEAAAAAAAAAALGCGCCTGGGAAAELDRVHGESTCIGATAATAAAAAAAAWGRLCMTMSIPRGSAPIKGEKGETSVWCCQ